MASLSQPPRLGDRLPIVLAAEDETDGSETLLAGDSDTETEFDARKHYTPVEPAPRLPPPPQHPIPSMQDGFAESLVEAMGGTTQKPKLRTGDAKARRDELLDQDKEDPPPGATWRFRPGQKCHELRRLMAQISFGVYLLLNGMANSQISVFSILQGHIDEVDEFLETTLEDIGLATKDLEDRMAHLKLPMDNVDVFERMLEDRNFRLQILEGNLKIEHIVARTNVALEQTVQDLGEAVASTREFAEYLAKQENGRWRLERPDVIDIFAAMKGNTDGWSIAFVDLQSKASHLETVIHQLIAMIAEIEKRAEKVSRRARLSIQQPHVLPKQSHRISDASSITTPPASPARVPSSPLAPRLPNTPPRISLRLSSINQIQYEPLFSFDMTIDEDKVLAPIDRPQSIQQGRPPQVLTPPVDEEPAPMISPPARNPRRISQQPVPRVETTEVKEEKKEKDEKVEEEFYILQPRTYTPQPPSPLPSPRIMQEAPKSKPQPQVQRVDSPKRSAQAMQSMQSLEQSQPRVIPQQLRAQVSKPKLVAIAPRNENKSSPKRNPPPMPGPSPARSPQQLGLGRQQDAESEPQPRQRTSLRQRVSLKTTPPESIQVPPREVVERRQPVQLTPRTFQAPDSAYGSDVERPRAYNNNNSISSIEPDLLDFPIPTVRPTLIPSPHSDQQFFRPVQASPHSPLQQRPHTSGTVNGGYAASHHGYPARNIPSAMGMSTLSNVTTMTSDTGRSVKKKRSAFGWLKKAFTMDEEEKAAFEQKRREQPKNPYYDGRSPQFLDGKRIQPRQHGY
ncbi:hypothetical protein QBC37DRAFT_274061 [Rhypophila decipiens]|uniref:Uncharacterized protein n=1 Tax=Rhypophila decipiens TaxID=261697 RepID=A0AAN6YGR8_9PEZI|nr:hypothetical protein QBC37DRAFT_274061 [Rhypophila decipiens]